MEKFKKGDRVRHLLTGQKMTVKRTGNLVVTCIKDVPEPFILMGIEYAGEIAVCYVTNLEKIAKK